MQQALMLTSHTILLSPTVVHLLMFYNIHNTNSFSVRQLLNKGKKERPLTKLQNGENKKGYQSMRGKKFKGNHLHSIVKTKRLKDEKLEREYPEVRSDFSLEVVDKTLVNSCPLTS